MRNTLQEQYNLLKEGKGNKQQFFKSARQLFPNLVTPINTYEDTVRILKNRGIITEGIGGVVTKGKTPDWHSIFNENMNKLKEGKKEIISQLMGPDFFLSKKEESTWDDADIDTYNKITKMASSTGKVPKLNEAKEAKAEEKETTKEVADMATRGYDYKDYKNIDNIYGEAFLKGFYTEMGDPKNEGKTVEELRQIVAKNMAKDCLHYTKEGQFGLKGVGYTVDAPGLGESIPAKGPHKSSGYGDLKESILRSQIYLLVKEVLTENTKSEIIDALYNKYTKEGEQGLVTINDDEEYKKLTKAEKAAVKDRIRFDIGMER